MPPRKAPPITLAGSPLSSYSTHPRDHEHSTQGEALRDQAAWRREQESGRPQRRYQVAPAPPKRPKARVPAPAEARPARDELPPAHNIRPPKNWQAPISTPSDFTEADIVSQVAEAFVEALHAHARVADRRVSVAMQADPLGLRSGEYARRPRAHPAEPTFERRERAAEAAEKFERIPVLRDDGTPTGHEIARITPALAELHRRRTIDAQEFEAMTTFCEHWHYAKFPGPTVARYRERVDGSGRHVAEGERVLLNRDRIFHAVKAIDPFLYPALAWLVTTLGDAQPLWKLGAYYSPGSSQPVQSAKGRMAAQFLAAQLCRHYRIEHRLARSIQVIVQELIGGGLVAA